MHVLALRVAERVDRERVQDSPKLLLAIAGRPSDLRAQKIGSRTMTEGERFGASPPKQRRKRLLEVPRRDPAQSAESATVKQTISHLRRKFASLHAGQERWSHPQRDGGDEIMTDSVLARLAALKTTPTPELKDQWRELFGKEPPPFNRRYIESRLAYKLQKLTYGGLKPETVARLEALGEQLDGGVVEVWRKRADDRPIAGTRLIREWQGVGGPP